MLKQFKWMAAMGVSLVVIFSTVLSASAMAPAGVAAAPARACNAISPTDVVWVTLTDDGDIDEQVDSYPAGTAVITPVFEYKCLPKKITLVTVFYLDGEAIFSDKESLKATKTRGRYAYPLGTEDESAMDEGEWTVEFYNNKTLLTSGAVVIGEAGPNSDTDGTTVTVEGVVSDKKTKKPVNGAVVLVFTPGVTVQQWLDEGQQQEQVLTVGKADSTGEFKLQNPLTRETAYAILVTSRGYKPTGTNSFFIRPDDPEPVVINVQMTR